MPLTVGPMLIQEDFHCMIEQKNTKNNDIITTVL